MHGPPAPESRAASADPASSPASGAASVASTASGPASSTGIAASRPPSWPASGIRGEPPQPAATTTSKTRGRGCCMSERPHRLLDAGADLEGQIAEERLLGGEERRAAERLDGVIARVEDPPATVVEGDGERSLAAFDRPGHPGRRARHGGGVHHRPAAEEVEDREPAVVEEEPVQGE